MPELPEVEHLRRTLLPQLVGARISSFELRRADMLREGSAATVKAFSGATVTALERLGKQLLVATNGPALIVQLGMSGSLFVPEPSDEPSDEFLSPRKHLHATLHAEHAARRRSFEVRFHDPRRFGALRAFDSRAEAIEARWSTLGPDALTIDPRELAERLRGRRGGLKASLLDQQIVAGLGNIYVDELLHAQRLHPACPACTLRSAEIERLAVAMRELLQSAIDVGGSTVRDYRDASGRPGEFVSRHRVYGRAGQPCLGCGARLRSLVAGGRTTVFCPTCQRRGRRVGHP